VCWNLEDHCLHKVQDTFSIKVKIVKSIFTNAQYVTLQKYFSHPSFSNFFSNHTHKTDTGTGSTWKTTNSRPLGLIKLSKYDLTLFSRLLQGYESCTFFQGPSTLPVDSLDLSHELHPRGVVQGHIVSVGGDALNMGYWGGDALQSFFL